MEKSSFKLVNKLAELFKIGDQGRVDSLFTTGLKETTRDIKTLKGNLSQVQNLFDNEIEELKDQLEDAQSDLDNQFQTINPEELGSKEAEKRVFKRFVADRQTLKANVDSIKEAIKDRKERFKNDKEGYEAQIAAHQEIIDNVLTKEK